MNKLSDYYTNYRSSATLGVHNVSDLKRMKYDYNLLHKKNSVSLDTSKNLSNIL